MGTLPDGLWFTLWEKIDQAWCSAVGMYSTPQKVPANVWAEEMTISQNVKNENKPSITKSHLNNVLVSWV